MTTVAAFLLVCQAASTDVREAVFLRTAKAIMQVESGGDPYAVGDGGKARGPYQIHRGYWADGTRLLGVTWPYEQARDPVQALAVVRAYTMHYARVHRQPWTPETIARIHNGGPTGWRKAATLEYWGKVEKIIRG
jgi:soluble lytic murein transglycosylase-like protein